MVIYSFKEGKERKEVTEVEIKCGPDYCRRRRECVVVRDGLYFRFDNELKKLERISPSSLLLLLPGGES